MSLPKSSCLSSASTSFNPAPTSSTLLDFPDHYAALSLDHWATTDEVKCQFRTLRAAYFKADAGKYRGLQMAYAVLVDPESRREYDAVWRVRRGLPPAPTEEEVDEFDRFEEGRMEGGKRGKLVKKAVSRSVKDAVSRVDKRVSVAGPSVAEIEEQRLREEEKQRLQAEEEELRQAEEHRLRAEEEQRRLEEEEQQRIAEEELQRARAADPNWALKHYTPCYKPLLGTQPYTSYIPFAARYLHDSRSLKMKARRPGYMGEVAVNALP